MTQFSTPTSNQSGFFTKSLGDKDSKIEQAIQGELARQRHEIELIASENIVSKAVLQAQGSIMTNKYAEGYSGKRYYGGCEFVDIAETLAIERVTKLFNCKYANVQPHSGSQANQAVFMSLMNPGDTFMGLALSAGGHLTHGAPPNQSGKWFKAISYGVRQQDHLIDIDEVASLAKQHKPKLIIAGGSAYPRAIDFAAFRKIADEVGALFMVDMAHFAGLVAAGLHENPLAFADVVTSTTHKTLRGARGGLVLSNSEEIIKKVNSAVFPGLQGGPLMHTIAGKAVAFGEALEDDFKTYIKHVIENAAALAEALMQAGYNLVSGGTDTHIVLLDLQSKNLTGVEAEAALKRINITCNKNTVPFDKQKPTITSGIRLGTPAATTRGFQAHEFRLVGEYIAATLDGLARDGVAGNQALEQSVKEKVIELTSRFPIYPEL